MDDQALKAVWQKVDSYKDEAIALQKSLTSIPALSPESGGDGEAQKSEVILRYLSDALKCSNIQTYNAPDDRVASGFRPNIIATFAGNNNSKTLWIMSHIDVVPAPDTDKWNSDPWQIKVDGDKIYGRGTEDNQQGITSSLLMAKAFVESEVKSEVNIGLIFVSDEETGSKFGVQYLLNKCPNLIKPDDLIVIPDSGNEHGTVVEVAEKSILWTRIEVKGRQTHASTPELGINAHHAAARLVVELEQLYQKFNASNPVFDPSISTFEATKREANVPNVNTVPGEDVFYLDARILPFYAIDDVKNKIREYCNEVENACGVTVSLSYPQELKAPPATPVKASIVTKTIEAIEAVKNQKAEPIGIGGGTVAAFFRQKGFNAVVWATQDETLHEANEYAKISNIIGDAKVFSHIALSG